VVDVLHYPLLLRWSHWYRGPHPSRFLEPRTQPGDTPQLQHNTHSSASTSASLAFATTSSSSSVRDGGGGDSSSSSSGGRFQAEPEERMTTQQAAASGLLSCSIAGEGGVLTGHMHVHLCVPSAPAPALWSLETS
jgi:hypothetical protein